MRLAAHYSNDASVPGSPPITRMTDAVPYPTRRWLLIGTLACAMACGGAPEPDKVLTTVRSWTATAALATADVHRGAISKRLAAQLHDRAVEARQESAPALAQAAHSPDDRQRAKAALDSLDSAIRTLGAAGGAQ